MKNLMPAYLVLLASLLASSMLAGCSQDQESRDPAITTSSAPPGSTAPVLSWDGYGPIHFGMNLEEAERVAGTRDDRERVLDSACDYTSFASLDGVGFMVENAVITRAVAGQHIPNSLGISVGDSLESITTAHAEAIVTPHKYDPAGRYVLFKSPAGDRAILLEIEDGVVALIRAGLEPAVEYVESCG